MTCWERARVAKRGEIWVKWSHTEACPGNMSVLDPRWLEEQNLCTCGMPTWEVIAALQELCEARLDLEVRK